MTTAAELLKLIETVDPSDSAKLDEIDARVWCWMNSNTYDYCFRNNANELVAKTPEENVVTNIPLYTRSRDALKAIRPEGWYFFCNPKWCIAETKKYDDYTGNKLIFESSPYCKTEELAELHAIIQAIDYERNNEKT